jgi:hypothetical protein
VPSAPVRRILEPLKSDKFALTRTTHADVGERKLSRLCDGLSAPQRRGAAIELFRFLTAGWSHWPVGDTPAWQTDITDDGTPFEFSVAFGGAAPQVRLLVESQQDPIGHLSSWCAGLRLNERLRSIAGVDLERFERIRELFVPGERATRFEMWHAAGLDPDGSPSFKLYLNPQVLGPQLAKGIVSEALKRLSLDEAWRFLSTRARGDGERNSFIYFSLDLSSAKTARVKVYVAHERATAKDIEAALEGCADQGPGDATRWLSGLLGSLGPFEGRPLLTCFAFCSSGAPPRATLHVPVRSYLQSDAEAVERAGKFLQLQQAKALRSAVSQVCARPLEHGCGALTYVSFKRLRRDTCISAYIAPEAYTFDSRAYPGPSPLNRRGDPG